MTMQLQLHLQSSAKEKQIVYQPVSIESSCGGIDDDDRVEASVNVHPHAHMQQQAQQPSYSSSPTTIRSSSVINTSPSTAFFLLGLLNNIVYVIVLASAKTIAPGNVGVVYTANILPALTVKLSSPLWFHRTTYLFRLVIATLSALIALTLIGTSSDSTSTDTDSTADNSADNEMQVWKLVGVACVSLQCGLGEATLLALAGKWDTHHDNNDITTNQEEEGVVNADADTDNASASVVEEEEEECATNESDPDPLVTTTTTTTTTAPNSSRTTTHNKATALTAFSSGTGLAGPAGFGWTVLFTQGLQWSLNATALVSLVLPITYLLLYMLCLQQEEDEPLTTSSVSSIQSQLDDDDDDNDSVRWLEHTKTELTHISKEHDPLVNNARATTATTQTTVSATTPLSVATAKTTTNTMTSKPTTSMTLPERVAFCCHLWPYCIPLFTVYAAEYACQAGAWTAIGFPTVTTSEAARNDFYVAAGWWYQTGVFVSRSSGHLTTVNMTVLWILPALQVCNLILFCYTAAAAGFGDDGDADSVVHHHDALLASWLYQQPVLLLGAFVTGLLGGAVYVHGYKRITADYGKHQVELALSATSVAEGLGVLFADVASLFIQSCLYQIHGLSGAIVTCPF